MKTLNNPSLRNKPLKANITISQQPVLVPLVYICDAWRFFQACIFANIMMMFAIAETTMFPESKHNLLRETFLNRPGIGNSTFRTVQESQIIRSNNTDRIIQDNTRERDRSIVLFTPLIWITGHFYAFSPTHRHHITMMLIHSGVCPELWSELFKRTRTCSNEIFRWDLGVGVGSAELLLNANPKLRGTFYDPAFLGTQTGMRYIVSLIKDLSESPGNYIRMVEATPQSLPAIESSQTVTMNAITINPTTNYTDATAYVVMPNSLQQVSEVHLADAMASTTYYLDSTTQEVFNRHFLVSKQYVMNMSWQSIVNHIVYRCTGLEPNFTRAPGDSKPQKHDEESIVPDDTKDPSLAKKDSDSLGKRDTTKSRTDRRSTRRDSFAHRDYRSSNLPSFYSFMSDMTMLYNSLNRKSVAPRRNT